MRSIVLLFVAALASAAMVSPLEARLQMQCRGWQQRLGLTDWNVSVRVVRQADLERNTWGNADWDEDRKSAVIHVLDPRDYNLKGTELRRDMECTIVHELVHIQLSPLDARNKLVREDVVNSVMTALLNRPCPN